MSINPTMAEKKTTVSQMINGWSGTLPPSLASVMVQGESLSSSQVLQRLGGVQALLDAPDAAYRAYRAAVSQRNQGAKAGLAFFAHLSAVVRESFAEPKDPTPFGLTPLTPPAKPFSETLAIAQAKRQTTREARRILGSRQRAAITTAPKPTLMVHGLPTPNVSPTTPGTLS